MTQPSAVAMAPALSFRESLAAIAYLGLGSVYLHITALWTWRVLTGDGALTLHDFVDAGAALAIDAGWVIPTGVGLIIAAYVALFGDSVIRRRGHVQSAADLAVIAALAIAAMLLGFTTTATVGIFAGAENPARAFPAIGFAVLAVLLGAKAGTAFWGNPAGQLKVAVQEEADARIMRLRLATPSTTRTARTVAAVGWTVMPPAVFAVVVIASTGGSVAGIVVCVAGLVTLGLTAWGFGYFIRYWALSVQKLPRLLALLGLGITSVSIAIPFVAIWSLSGAPGRVTLIVLTAIVIASAVVPLPIPFTVRTIARERAYLRLTYRIPRMQVNTSNARNRQRFDADAAAAL